MTVQVRRGSKDDAVELANVRYAAFRDNQIDSAIFPMTNPDAMRAWFYEQCILDLKDAHQEIIVAVDESTGRIASSMRWFHPRNSSDKEQPQASDPTENIGTKHPSSQFPIGANTALGEAFFHSLSVKQKQYIKPGRDYCKFGCRPQVDHRDLLFVV